MLRNRRPTVMTACLCYQVKMYPIKRGIRSIGCDTSMNTTRPEDKCIPLFKREHRCLLAQNQGARPDKDEFIGVDYPLGMDSVRRRNKESGIASFKLRRL